MKDPFAKSQFVTDAMQRRADARKERHAALIKRWEKKYGLDKPCQHAVTYRVSAMTVEDSRGRVIEAGGEVRCATLACNALVEAS